MHAPILVAGETLVDFLPDRPGALDAVESFERRPGGAPANVAVGLARLEHPPLFWTRVGEDGFGAYLERTLTDEGIPETFIETDGDAQTTLAFVTHDDDGDRAFSFYRDGTADTRLETGRVDDDTLDSLEWVHVGGVTLSQGPARDATFDLLERASQADCTVSFDPNARPELWTDHDFADSCRRALEHVDVCKATVEELQEIGFSGEGPEVVARNALESGLESVFVTMGGDGAMAVADRESPNVVTEPGLDVDVVDTTGAGDGFVAGVIAGAREGHPLPELLRFATVVASRATTRPGAMSALPDRDTVAKSLADVGSETA